MVVQWPVRMWRVHEHLLDTYTVNVSSGGFYCVCSQPFSPGEMLIAVLEIPGACGDREPQKLLLRCEVLVLRIETVIDSCDCGIACRIINYSVLRARSMASGSEQPNTKDSSLLHNKVDGWPQKAALSERS